MFGKQEYVSLGLEIISNLSFMIFTEDSASNVGIVKMELKPARKHVKRERSPKNVKSAYQHALDHINV